jgi:hypothetical protein
MAIGSRWYGKFISMATYTDVEAGDIVFSMEVVFNLSCRSIGVFCLWTKGHGICFVVLYPQM